MYNSLSLYSIHSTCVYSTTPRTAAGAYYQLAVDTHCSSQTRWLLKTQSGIYDVRTNCTYIA